MVDMLEHALSMRSVIIGTKFQVLFIVLKIQPTVQYTVPIMSVELSCKKHLILYHSLLYRRHHNFADLSEQCLHQQMMMMILLPFTSR